MSQTPIFASVGRLGIAALSAANTNRDGTGTIVDALTGVAAGTRIDRLRVCATATTAAGVVRVFLHNGTAYKLYKEYIVPAITPSTTVEVWSVEEKIEDVVLPSASWKIAFSTHNAETFNAFALGSDLT